MKPMEAPYGSVRVFYPRYRRSLVIAQKSRYDQFPPVAHGGEPSIPYRIRPHHSWLKRRCRQPKKN
jgi:hypothetical protein